MQIVRPKWNILILLGILCLAHGIQRDTISTCTVTVSTPENNILVSFKYLSVSEQIDKTRICFQSPLSNLIDFGNLCNTIEIGRDRLIIRDCDDRTPNELTLTHDIASWTKIKITLHGFNFPPEGQLFSEGSVMVNAHNDFTWGTPHDFKCDAFSSPPYTLSNTLYIYNVESKLIAYIKGSDQNIPINFEFELDASNSLDPENRNKTDAVTFTWSCEELSPNAGQECLQKDGNNILSLLKPEAKIWIPEDIFVENVQMKFSLLIKENPYPANNPRSASESVLITIKENAKYQISIQESDGNAATKGFSPNIGINLEAIVRESTIIENSNSGDLELEYKWSSNIFNFTEEYIKGPLGRYHQIPPLTTKTSENILEVSVNVREGNNINIIYTGNKQLEINKPPIGGILNISPTTGISMITTFTFIASDWVDVDWPLSYTFFYSRINNSDNTHNKWKLLVQKRADNHLGNGVVLPQGNSLNSYIIYVKLRVADVYGTYTDIINQIIVNPYPITGVLGQSLFDVAKQMMENIPDTSLDLVLQVINILYYIVLYIYIL